MSKINLEAPFMDFRGKVCKHSKIIFKKVRQTNFTSQICNPRTKAFSAEELARQSKFRSAAVAAKTALADPTTRATYEAGFKTQTKYQTLFGYVLAQEYAKLGD